MRNSLLLRTFVSVAVTSASGALSVACHQASSPEATAHSAPVAPPAPALAPPAQPMVPMTATLPAAAAAPPAPAAPPPTPPPAATVTIPGHDFIVEAKALMRVGACGDGDIPADLDADVVNKHCAAVRDVQAQYKAKWLDVATPFFAAHVPHDIPKTVVYPFAGGDLSTALTVFNDADEITTLSLEPPGDPRTLTALKGKALVAALAKVEYELHFLYTIDFSNTMNLIGAMRDGELPTQLIFSLSAMRLHGYEPVALHYFRVKNDGTLEYLTDADVAAAPEPTHGNADKRNRIFGAMELTFRKVGETRLRTYRHIQANLDNPHIAKSPGVMKYLQARGEHISAMTKAASYLLSWETFSTMRDFLLAHVDWMISDATGVAPKWGPDKGFTYETYGTFEGPHMSAGLGISKDWSAEFSREPKRELPFRFGYPAKHGKNHLIIMKRSK